MSITLNHLYPTARRPLIVNEDHEGCLIVHVGLARGQSAVLDHGDFNRLMAMGLSPNWVLASDGDNRLYVRARPPASFGRGSLVSIPRLILPPPFRGMVVKHRDGDRLNLTRRNLELVEGITQAHAWEWDIVKEHLALAVADGSWEAFA